MSIFKKLFGRDKISRRRPVVSRGRLLGFEYLEDRRMLAIVISGNEISNVGGDGISLSGAASVSTISVESNTVSDAGGSGITISGTTGAATETTVNDNSISGTGGDGINVDGYEGAYLEVDGNSSTGAGGDGISLTDISNVEATIHVGSNTVSDSMDNGILLDDFYGTEITFEGNETNSNLGNGLAVYDYNGTGAEISFGDHTSDGNILDGIAIDEVMANLSFDDIEATNNVGNGISLDNVENTDEPLEIVDSNLSGNGVGTAAGLDIHLDNGGSLEVGFDNTVIDDNATGVSVTARNVDSEIIVDFEGVTSISNTGLNAIEASALAGGSVELYISDIAMVDNSSLGGSGIDLLADDLGTGDYTTLYVEVDNIDMTNQGGTGVEIDVIGNSNLDFSFDNSSIEGSVGDQININLDVSNNDINYVDIYNSTFDGSGSDAFDLSVNDETWLSIYYVNNEVIDPADEGVEIDAGGNTQTQVALLGNDLTDDAGQSSEGVQINVSGDAEVLANIYGNSIDGYGTNGDPSIMADGAVADPEWGEGIEVNVDGTATVGIYIVNNSLTDNGLEGIDVQTFGGETSVYAAENILAGNDLTFAIDTTPPPPDTVVKAPFQQDLEAETFGGTMNFALDDNIATTGFLIDENFGTLEYEDGTNTPSATTQGGVTVSPFDPNSSDTLDNISALSDQFIADGFPPL